MRSRSPGTRRASPARRVWKATITSAVPLARRATRTPSGSSPSVSRSKASGAPSRSTRWPGLMPSLRGSGRPAIRCSPPGERDRDVLHGERILLLDAGHDGHGAAVRLDVEAGEGAGERAAESLDVLALLGRADVTHDRPSELVEALDGLAVVVQLIE